MTLMFNKETLEPKWFRTWECKPPDDTTGYTEKIPPDTSHYWNNELNEWVLPPIPETEEPKENGEKKQEEAGENTEIEEGSGE